MMNTEPEELFDSAPEGEPTDDSPACEGNWDEDEHEYEHDGQPDWAQEWHDFDPDC